MNMGGLNKSRRSIRGRKYCSGCGKVFGLNEFKSTFDFVHYFCLECDK